MGPPARSVPSESFTCEKEWVQFLTEWPRPFFVASVCLMVYIAVAQSMDSMKLTYYYDYTADVEISEFDYTDQVDAGSEGAAYEYTVWQGARSLWSDGACLIAILLVLWSGLWPYFKLLILAAALWAYRKGRLPRRYEWLSTVAHWSFIDMWMVVAMAMMMRFYYKGDDSDSIDSVGTLEITLLVWVAAVARGGAYHFFSAIAASQTLGFVAMKYAQLPSPPYARDR